MQVTVTYAGGDRSPEEYWIDVPELGGSSGLCGGEPWVVAMMPLAAALGEPLVVEAPTDGVLVENLRELGRVWSTWYPDIDEIDVETEPGPAAPAATTSRVAALFSGGVDSFFTLLRAREAGRPSERVEVTDLVTIWGFDIPLGDRGAFERLVERHHRIAGARGCRLLPVATNLRQMRWGTVDWPRLAHGCGLAAPCHALQGHLGTVLVPSGSGYRDLRPWASHPLTDPLMSSSRLGFVHDGASSSRLDKLLAVAASPLALEHLRVCWRGESDTNCERCTKCLMTMVGLEVAGVLGSASCFDADAVPLASARRIYCAHPWERRDVGDLLLAADRNGSADLAAALARSLRGSAWRSRALAVGGGLRRRLEPLLLAGWSR